MNITHLETPNQLACWYDGQHAPQGCHIALDLETGELTADYNPETGGGIPASVYHHRTLWIEIPRLPNTAANAFLDEIAPLAERILAGASIVWDGSNHVGHLDQAAQAACDELAAACSALAADEPEEIQWFYAGVWYSEESDAETAARLGITADTTDEKMAAIVSSEEAEVETEGAILRRADIKIDAIREDLRDAARERLAEIRERLAELTGERNELIRAQLSWGDSSRAVGDRAGMSHTNARAIAG